MPDSIVLLEERKEVTTFLLDEGTITATTVTTPTGETPYEFLRRISYEGLERLYPEVTQERT